ncbi:MAG: S-adenosyl-L-methionine-dependent methyltransferase [Benjaminiella poitrasii]|nr:MAG: S-adenosyl-L-methionine-dependent methyltransferase [Benjaminiella poitrasii]
MNKASLFFVAYICILLPVISIFTTGALKSICLYLHALGAACGIWLLTNSRQQQQQQSQDELYGISHPILSNLNMTPKTFWFNMGLWDKEGLSFPEACENLVDTVARKLNIQPNLSILDVGFGCGDSCIFLAERYKSKVTGITNESSQWRLATDRINNMNLDAQINLLHGSANDLDTLLAPNKPYNHIISIDSAYHFNTRWDFLKKAYARLKDNDGTIGIYDLTIDPAFLQDASRLHRYVFQLVSGLIQIPLQNWITAETYRQQMIEVGYEQVEVELIDRQLVFGGLARSFRQQYHQAVKYGIATSPSSRIYLKLSSLVFGFLATKPWLVPVIVKGCKRERNEAKQE